jgi:hypothetical protein
MSGNAVAKIPKPDLRGALIKQIKINIIGAFIGATIVTGTWWYFVNRQRKLNYENFHKNYDFDKEYARMK